MRAVQKMGFIAILLTALYGCQSPAGRYVADGIILPRHPSSGYDQNEDVTIVPLTSADLLLDEHKVDTPLGKDGKNVFGTTQPKMSLYQIYLHTFEDELKDDGITIPDFASLNETQGKQQLAAFSFPALGALVGSEIIRNIQNEFKKEAGRYEASFSKSISRSGFYNYDATNKLRQRIFAFKIERIASYDVKEAGESCYEMYLGMYISEKNRLMKVVPLSMRMGKSKAKVLKLGLDLAWLWGFLLNQSDSIYSNTQISFSGIYSNRNQNTLPVSMGPLIEIEHKKYELGSDVWRFNIAPEDNGGWIAAPPVTEKINGNGVTGNGAYSIRVNVLEKDLSNAKEHITTLSDEVQERSGQLFSVQ